MRGLSLRHTPRSAPNLRTNRHPPGLRRSADLARISRSRSTSSCSTQNSFRSGEAPSEKSEPFALCHSPTVVGPVIYQYIIWLSRVCSISEQRRKPTGSIVFSNTSLNKRIRFSYSSRGCSAMNVLAHSLGVRLQVTAALYSPPATIVGSGFCKPSSGCFGNTAARGFGNRFISYRSMMS